MPQRLFQSKSIRIMLSNWLLILTFHSVLLRLAAADAQSAAISKALVHSKVSNSLIAKLYMGVANQYDTANGLLSSLPNSEIASDLKRYLSDGTAFYKVISQFAIERKTAAITLTNMRFFPGNGKEASEFGCE
jgi:hypothetical protein